MTSRLNEIVIDGPDPAALAGFWCAVLGWEVVDADDDCVELLPAPQSNGERRTAMRADAVIPSLVIVRTSRIS